MSGWAHVRRELERLLALTPQDRQPELERIEGEAPELACELRALLAHDHAAQEASDFLVRKTAPQATAPERRRIGPYELLHELGSGGMGVVHLARRADGAYERRVAVKLLRATPGDETLLARFLRERQVLANLEHAGIARMIDGGTHEGQPYLVLEYVEGTPIDRYCDEGRLPVRARIELFLAVCAAVQHAHGHLVVHRDLKPQNILVTEDGRPKLLDFGIAKLLDPEKASLAGELTLGSQRFLTPAYASPEQVSGRTITTASDVYSLGVVLYRLLTGRLPYAVETTSAAELERIVCEVRPTRPSTSRRTDGEAASDACARVRRTTPRGLMRALEGDLDRILLKALSKEPRQRYASVEAFADDLGRHLSGLPVRARPATLRYRTARFLRRNRALALASGMAGAALLAGLVTTWREHRDARRAWAAERQQRELAEERLAESRQLARVVRQERTLAEERAEELSRTNEELLHQRGLAEDRSEELQHVATAMVFDLHDELFAIPGTEGARRFVLSSGIDVLDRLTENARGRIQRERELAGAYTRIAGLQGSWGESQQTELDAARRNADRAVDLARASLAGELTDRIDWADRAIGDEVLVQALAVRSGVSLTAGDEAGALEDLREAIALCRPYLQREDTSASLLRIASFVHGRAGQLLLPFGALDEAESLLGAAVAVEERLLALGASSSGDALAAARADLAQALFANGRHTEAIEHFVASLDQLERSGEHAAPSPASLRRLQSVRLNFALCLVRFGDLDGATLLLEAAELELRARVSAAPRDRQAQIDLLTAMQYRMLAAKEARDWPSVLELSEGALPIATGIVETGPLGAHDHLAKLHLDRGIAHRQLGRHLEAVEELTRAKELLEALVAEGEGPISFRRHLVTTYSELGRAYRASGDASGSVHAHGKAVHWYDRALALISQLERGPLQAATIDERSLLEERDRARAAVAASEGS